MDWTKAKTILIVALIATNLFLIFTYGFNKPGENENREDVLIDVLANNNITLLTKVPERQGKLPVLYIEYSEFNKEETDALLNREIYSVVNQEMTEESLVDFSDRFLQELGLLRTNMVLDQVEIQENLQVVRYKNEIDGMPVEESYIYCTFDGGRLIGVDSYWLEAKNFSEKKMNIISASEALIFFTSQFPDNQENIQIEKIELVYWLDTSSFDGEELVKDTALPAWKISYNEDRKKYIYAYVE